MRQTNRKRTGKIPHTPTQSTPQGLLFHLGKGMLISLSTGALLLLFGALCSYFLPDPTAPLLPIGLLIAAVTSFIGGFATRRLHGQAALICGLLHGTLLCSLMLVCSLFFVNAPAWVTSNYGNLTSALLHAGVILLSILGAYLAGQKRQPKRRKR